MPNYFLLILPPSLGCGISPADTLVQIWHSRRARKILPTSTDLPIAPDENPSKSID